MNGEGAIQRLLGGVSGHVYMRVALVLQTTALVPILVAAWGVEGYGTWLALTALSSYVGISNFGLSDASGSAMLLAVGAGEPDRAATVFETTLGVLTRLSVVVMLAMSLLITAPVADWLKLAINPVTASVVLLAVAAQVWLGAFKGVYAAAISTTGRFGLSNAISGTGKMIEIVLLGILTLLFDQGLIAAALVLAGVAAVDLFVQRAMARRLCPWTRQTGLRVDRGILRDLWQPSLGSLVLQLGVNGIVVQGPRIALSALLGPAAVAVFAIHATIARLTQQVVSMLAGPMMLEMSLAVGAKDYRRALRLMSGGLQVTTMLGLAGLLAAGILGVWFVPTWTAGEVRFVPSLFALFGIMTLINNMAAIPLGLVVGANRVLRPASRMLLAAGGAIALGTVLTPAGGIEVLAAASALAELVFLLIILAEARAVLATPFAAFLKRLVDFGDIRGLVRQRLPSGRGNSKGA